jgi:CheY-like chemotaxis protein
LLAEDGFALAILDIRMPGMDGFELLAKIRGSGIRVPALIVTAYSEVPNAVKAIKLKDNDKAKKCYGQAIKLDREYEPGQLNMRRLFKVDHFGSSNEPVHLGGEMKSMAAF